MAFGLFGAKPFANQLGNTASFRFPLASPFATAGADTIDARAAGVLGITAYGGAGNDTIVGSQAGDFLAGGSGDDTIQGADGIDQIYGDSGVNVDIRTRALTIPTANSSTAPNADLLVAGRDTLFGEGAAAANGAAGAFADVIFGDHGAVIQDTLEAVVGPNGYDRPTTKLEKIQTTLVILEITTREPANGAADAIDGNAGRDRILGGNGADTVNGNDGDDIVLGDNGRITYAAPDSTGGSPLLITTTDPTVGAADVINGNGGNDMLFGGTAGDTIAGDDGNDLIFGDHGRVDGTIDSTQLPLSSAIKPFAWTSIDTSAASGGGADLLRGNAGDDIVIGGQDADRITGGDGDDDLIGGHNVAGGADSGDQIDAGAGNDWVAGDNANILRTGSRLSPRFRTLTGAVIYDANGLPQVGGTPQLDPNLANEERTVTLFDHSATPAPGTSGADNIAGGADDDVLFGQLGTDWIQGDGSVIDDAGLTTIDVRTTRRSVEDWAGIGRDGRDWVEGNGGDDAIFGGLGQDDLIGGSSSLYSLTAAQRIDGADMIFGGAGVQLVRNDFGDMALDGHAHDADVIMGDNADIFRLLTAAGAFRTFAYDNYSTVERIIPRAFRLLDYVEGAATGNVGAADLLHGEAGDDTIHGQTGNDVLFGEGQDDDIVGGTGFDRIYGGTGQDGLLGDDGKMLTSRNGIAEPLNRLPVAEVETFEGCPGGKFIGGVVDILGELKKRAMLAVHTIGWNDIIYGGLGDDFIHGGAGDDALSGAEAMAEFYNELPQTNGDPLDYNEATTMFPAWNNTLPFAKIPDFLLNFDAFRVDEATGAVLSVNGLGVKSADGRDRIFGDNGNDWIVGGTDCDWLFGGFGDDLLNLDDFLETDGGTNLRPESDERFNDGDFAFGGAGRDVLIANTGNDRMFDWTGEFNSFYAPFPTLRCADGQPHVLAQRPRLHPGDRRRRRRRRRAHAARAVRRDRPRRADDGALWQAQNGGPRDPQNIHGEGPHDTDGEPKLECRCDATAIVDIVKALYTADGTLLDVDTDGGDPVPTIPAGTVVFWRYTVRNLSIGTAQSPNVALLITKLRDDNGTPWDPTDDFTPRLLSGDTDGDGLLDLNETWMFTSEGVVVVRAAPGIHTNTVTVEVVTPGGCCAADTAQNRFVTPPPAPRVVQIAIVKLVNGVDANVPASGPVFTPGSPVTWTYVVTNPGTGPWRTCRHR